MSDVIHDPRTDWCACEPNSMNRCDYRLLADTVIEHLNPPDDDVSEVAICITAIENIAIFVKSLPCWCLSGDDVGPCERCEVLGQRHGKAVER